MAGTAHAADVSDGTCEWKDPRTALAQLDRDVALARDKADAPHACVPLDDPRRAAEERRELDHIEDAVKSAVHQKCLEASCVSNLVYSLTWFNPWHPTFGGCENWSEVAADAIGDTSYFAMRREQRCTVRPPTSWTPVPCHYVIVLQNLRDGSRQVVDAWSFAGGWSGAASRDPDRSVFGSWDDYRREYPVHVFADYESRGRCREPHNGGKP
jgi:hypothetical protein